MLRLLFQARYAATRHVQRNPVIGAVTSAAFERNRSGVCVAQQIRVCVAQIPCATQTLLKSECRPIGLSDRRTIEPSDYRTVGL